MIVHPHEVFDVDGVTTGYMSDLVRNFPGRPSVLQGYAQDPQTRELVKKRLPLTVPERDYQIFPSKFGEFRAWQMDLGDDMRVGLAGGYFGQCHHEAFSEIMKVVERKSLRNVTIVVPLGGTFVGDRWFDVGGVRHAGFRIFGFVYQAPVARSYSVKSTLGYLHEETPGAHLWYRNLRRNADGVPLLAAPEETNRFIREVLFEKYLEDRYERGTRGPLKVNLAIVGDSIEFNLAD